MFCVALVSDQLRLRTAAKEVLRGSAEIKLAVAAQDLGMAARRCGETSVDLIILAGLAEGETIPAAFKGVAVVHVESITSDAQSGTALEAWAQNLLESIREHMQPSGAANPGTAEAPKGRAAAVVLRRPPKTKPIDFLAIASSTGGPDALAVVLAKLPADLGVPVLIVQHMPPKFTSHLAGRLDSISKLKAREGYEGAVLEPNTVWIAPGDYHSVVKRESLRHVLSLNQGAPINFCRPAADPMLLSVAHIMGASTLAVVLTGMGHDGLEGCKGIVAAGGDVIVQDEESSVVWGMPGFVARAGIASAVLPLDAIAAAITERIKASRLGGQRNVG